MLCGLRCGRVKGRSFLVFPLPEEERSANEVGSMLISFLCNRLFRISTLV